MFFQQEINLWQIHCTENTTCVSRVFDSHRFTRCFLFCFLNLLEYLLCNFLLVFWLPALAFMFPAICSTKQVGQIFVFSNQVFYFFAEILSFVFCLVNSECDASLVVYHISVYSYPKIFRLFGFDLEPSLKPYFPIHISISCYF